MADAPFLAPVFGLPPKEAVAFFRQKGFRIGFDYRDVWQEEHQASFTVAKAMSVDLLQDIRQGVDAALHDGETLAMFSEKLTPLLVRRGWWGKQTMTDPLTGEEKEVQLGSPRRLKFIYDQNLRMAHAEGHWQRIQETKDALPYLMYGHVPQENERPEHAAWDGLVLRVDDPWWRVHAPVKALGCKCYTIQMDADGVQQRGLKIGDAPEEKYVEYTNKRTGETQMIPTGVDPMLNYPLGGRRENLVSFLAERLERLQDGLRPAAARALSGDAFVAWAEQPVGDWPIGVLSALAMKKIAAQTDVVRLSAETLQKQRREHPDLSLADYQRVQDTLERGEIVPESDRVIFFVLDEPAGFTSVVKATRTGKAAFLTSFRRLSSEGGKRAREIKRLQQKGKEK